MIRFDRCIASIVILFLSISTVLLIYGILTANTLSQIRNGNRNDNNNENNGEAKFLHNAVHGLTRDDDLLHHHDENDQKNKNFEYHQHQNSQKQQRQQPSFSSSSSSSTRKYFWGSSKNENHPIGWQQQIADQCSEEFHDSLPTYDDYVSLIPSADDDRRTKKKRRRKQQNSSSRRRQQQQQQRRHDEGEEEAEVSAAAAVVCDVFTVPFAGSGEESESICLEAMSDPSRWENVEMIQPKFEQRTVKYVVTLSSSQNQQQQQQQQHDKKQQNENKIKLLMKVPQASFATEPFGEITAFALDRMLHINRIPPTVLVPFPLARLHDAAVAIMPSFHMVTDLGYTETNFSKWWYSEFYKFVKKSQYPRVMFNDTHLWVSLQLQIVGVSPLLDSALRVPYSKRQSGWHRWFNPRWEGFAAVTNSSRHLFPILRKNNEETEPPQKGYEKFGNKPYSELLHAAMMSLSELAIFDFLMLNNDRSPNKNNFIVEGCFEKRKHLDVQLLLDGNTKNSNRNHRHAILQKEKDKFCSAAQLEARPAGNGGRLRASPPHSAAMTFVHLDQGMSFHGFSYVNNPLAKKHNNTFCMFYNPLMQRIRCFLAKHPDAAEAELSLRKLVPDVAERVLGRKKLKWMVGQLTLLEEKKEECVRRFGVDVALQPQRFPVV